MLRTTVQQVIVVPYHRLKLIARTQQGIVSTKTTPSVIPLARSWYLTVPTTRQQETPLSWAGQQRWVWPRGLCEQIYKPILSSISRYVQRGIRKMFTQDGVSF